MFFFNTGAATEGDQQPTSTEFDRSLMRPVPPADGALNERLAGGMLSRKTRGDKTKGGAVTGNGAEVVIYAICAGGNWGRSNVSEMRTIDMQY